MANTCYLVVGSGFGNVGEAPPNAIVQADMVVKTTQDQVVYSQPGGASSTLDVGDTYASIQAKLIASARDTMNDPSLQVVFL